MALMSPPSNSDGRVEINEEESKEDKYIAHRLIFKIQEKVYLKFCNQN